MPSSLFIYLFFFYTGWFKHFDFIERFSSNCNSNSFLERLSIKDLLVDSSASFLFNSLMWLYVLPISRLTILNFLLSRLILTNLHPGSLSILFFLFSYFFFFFFWSVCTFSSISIASLWSGRYRSIILPKMKYCSIIFIPGNDFIIIAVIYSSSDIIN